MAAAQSLIAPSFFGLKKQSLEKTLKKDNLGIYSFSTQLYIAPASLSLSLGFPLRKCRVQILTSTQLNKGKTQLKV